MMGRRLHIALRVGIIDSIKTRPCEIEIKSD